MMNCIIPTKKMIYTENLNSILSFFFLELIHQEARSKYVKNKSFMYHYNPKLKGKDPS